MKFKSQEESNENPFLKSIIDLIVVNKRFLYAIESMNLKQDCAVSWLFTCLTNNYNNLIKLATCLNVAHKMPTMTVEYASAESIDDLKAFEEKYYNMLKEVGNNALEENNAEVFSYLSPMISEFNHYFCTLDENNDSGETGS